MSASGIPIIYNMTEQLASLFTSEECKKVFDWIAAQEQTLIKTVEDWSLTNSGSKNLQGLDQMIQKVIDFAAPLNAEVDLIPLPDTEIMGADGQVAYFKNAPILRLQKRPQANRKLLFTGHLDTVFPTDSPFQTCRWLDDHILNGPGVADMKGGVLVMLSALMAFEQTAFADRFGWEVLLSPDEETGSLASGPVLMERAKTADMGLTYEPAMPDGTMAGERKGSGNYTLVVRGKSAHAGREFYKGRNAVVALSALIAQLSSLSGQKKGLTVNPAVITGGVAPNVVPDLAQCRFNVRLAKAEDQRWLESQLDQIIQKANEEDGISVVLHGGINRPPKEITRENQIMMDLIAACGDHLGMNITYQATGGCCEGNNLAAAGLPNVDTLGVVGGHIHSDQEYVDVTSFVPRIQLSTSILMAFAEGHFNEVIIKKD